MIERTDELLAQQVMERGDREALTSLIRRYQGPVYSYLLRLLKNPHDAEEAAQETFLRLIRGLSGYRADLPFRPWLYRIALNCARSKALRCREQSERERLAVEARPPRATPLTPADLAVRNEVLHFVDALPDAQKEAVTLHYCEGLSHSEVASVLDVPAGTVATRIHAGLQVLRGRLSSVGIALAGLTLEEALRSADAATAPSSILSTLLKEVAQGAPSGAGAASAVHGGLIVAKTKTSAMVAVAIACTVGGGVAGYGIRSTRAERQLSAMETTSRPRPADVAAPGNASVPAAAPLRPPAASSASTPPAIPVAPAKDAPTAKYRKFASFVAKSIKMSQGGPNKPEMGTKESLEFLSLLADPELQKFLTQGATGGTMELEGIGAEFYLALLEEFDVRLSDPQKAQFEEMFRDLAEVDKKLDEKSATAVDLRIKEFQSSRLTCQKIEAVLTPDQREKAKPLLHHQQSLGDGVPVEVESADRAAPSLLDCWNETLIPLSEAEKVRLASTAAVHAGRLEAFQAELTSQYGAEFLDRFSSKFGDKTSGSAAPDPDFDPKARDAYGRLLELERQNRVAMLGALPERAEEIRKAEANVYLLMPKKK